ncbi:MAG TPA: PilZ domain-containing protein [Polyangia bacterium]|nr:PilZ domain-containing protein [Polyangia bacterium]
MATARLAHEQRQFPRFGLGLPVTLVFGGRGESSAGELQDISCGGCFFKSRARVDVDRRISLELAASSGQKCRASGRVVRTLAYTGFAVLFDDDGSRAVGAFIKGIEPLTAEARIAYLSTELQPEIQIF